MNMPSYKDLKGDYFGDDYNISDLNVSCKHLNSLDGCPDFISGSFSCSDNFLTSLVGGPQKVDGKYGCSYNPLTDLIGCASHIGENLYLNNNSITSLVGIHKIIKSCPEIYFDDYKITQGGIGLLMIENLIDISANSKPFQIIKSYLGTGTKGMMECRKELLSREYVNYADYAKL